MIASTRNYIFFKKAILCRSIRRTGATLILIGEQVSMVSRWLVWTIGHLLILFTFSLSNR